MKHRCIPLMPRVFLLHSPNVQIVNKSGSMDNFYDDLNHFICLYMCLLLHTWPHWSHLYISKLWTLRLCPPKLDFLEKKSLDYTLWIGKHIFMWCKLYTFIFVTVDHLGFIHIWSWSRKYAFVFESHFAPNFVCCTICRVIKEAALSCFAF